MNKDIPHEVDSEWALAHALQTMTRYLRPAVRKAYKAETYEERVTLAKDAIVFAESVLATVKYAANPPEVDTR
jgi:hypothetical protein